MSTSYKGSSDQILFNDKPFISSGVSKKACLIATGAAIACLTISIVFIAMYAKENNANKELRAESGKSGKSTGDGSTNPPPTTPPTPPPTASPVKTTMKTSRPVVPTTAGTQPYWNIRLPAAILPVRYDVNIEVNLTSLVFKGKTGIEVKVTYPTKFVIIHVRNLNISKAELRDMQKALIRPVKAFEFKKNMYYVMEMDTALLPGNYSLYFEYRAMLASDLRGFYKSTYKRANGKLITIAATQFQPTDARAAFPCFDEPALKAKFRITLTHDSSMIAISNMPIEGSSRSGELTVDKFRETVVMSSYLVAFVICDFKSKSAKASNNVSMTFYAPPDQVEQLNYAIKLATEILPFFEKYYKVAYPLPKADLIAIPDFNAGAMENWGLMTYRETALLFQDGASSESNRQRVAIVVAHELAHQWFGNLVTNYWWSDLWLNEGFASFVENLGVDSSEPSWKMNDQVVIGDFSSGLYADSFVTSHPIHVPVNNPSEINEIFDSISYSKGGAILRMLDNFLTTPVFVKGLTNYLIKYRFASANTSNLWECLSEEAKNINVGQIMDTWTKQMGYPVVTVRSFSNGSVQLDQKRFLINPSANETKSKYKSPFGYKWLVPFTYQLIKKGSSGSIGNTPKIKWLNMTSATLPAGTKNGTHLVKGNMGHYGFFRVNYDAQGWQDLITQFKKDHTIFDPKDRAGVLGDVFSLARAEDVGYKTALDLFDYIGDEKEYVPWSGGLGAIGYFTVALTRTRPARKFLAKYILKKIDKRYNEILSKPPSSNQLDIFLRNTLRSTACGFGHKDCIANATKAFNTWLKDESKTISPESRSLSYFYGILNNGQEAWDEVFKRFQNSTVGSERIKLLYGLSAIQEPWMILRYLDYAIDDTKVKSQDTSYIFNYVANYNPIGRHHAWNYLKQNVKKISKKYGAGTFAIRRIFSSVTKGFTTKYELEEFDKFAATLKGDGTADRVITQAREKIKTNIKWLADNEKIVEEWLRNHV